MIIGIATTFDYGCRLTYERNKNCIGNHDGYFVDSVIEKWSIYFLNVKLIDDHST